MDDAARFRALFEVTFAPVRRYVHHRGVPPGRADDVVAETFLVAWRRLADVPADDPLPWLLAVARNAARNELRGRRRYEGLLGRVPVALPTPPPADPPDHDLADVRAALDALDEADRELLLLVAWDDLTPAQAARVLGCTPGTARVRLHRARRRFAAALGKRSGADGQIPDERHPDKELDRGRI
ncbi:MAG TPA: sigma-70 family RNA polymerase sigma factor [Acidimicrobiales bacterium]